LTIKDVQTQHPILNILYIIMEISQPSSLERDAGWRLL